MKTLFIAGMTAIAAIAAPAMAQSDAGNAFTGPRIELHGGWDRLHGKARVTDGVDSAHAGAHDNDGFFGLQAGYDYAIRPATVVGVFGSYDWSNNEKCGFVAVDTTACLKAKRNIEAGLRIGEAVTPRTLVYLKGAYVNGRFGASIADDAGDYASAHKNRDGWRAGVGAEYALAAHAYLKAEYNYTRYSRYSVSEGEDRASLRLDRQELLAGLGIRF
ncbi:outer membrane protein [Sphingomonas oryzagri]